MQSLKSIKELQLEDNVLAAEEACLQEILAKIKHQKMALEVERLQLNSILRTLEKQRDKDLNKQNETFSTIDTQNVPNETVHIDSDTIETNLKAELLDEAKSSINTRTLDLSIMNDFNDMVSNTCEEEDEDDDDESL